MLEAGDPNAMLGGHKSPEGLTLLRTKLFIFSGSPTNPICENFPETFLLEFVEMRNNISHFTE